MDPVLHARFRSVFARLSPAQQRSLRSVCVSGGRAEAAFALYRSESTIKNHATAAFRVLRQEGFIGSGRSSAQMCYLLGASDTCQEGS